MDYTLRGRVFMAVIVVAMGLLSLRLAQLQLLQTDDYISESETNALRERRVLPARGAIYDRRGRIVVNNEPSYTITITPRNFDRDKIPLLAGLLQVPDSVVAARFAELRRYSAFQPGKAFRDVPEDIFSRVSENFYRLPGVGYDQDFRRRYHTQATASHVLGYVREITDSELARLREQGYRQGDLIGKSGVESQYEFALRGRLGSEIKVVNVHGLEVKSWQDGAFDHAPTSGYDIHLGLDADVQALAESLFVGKRGGAVALDVNSGEILALVSKPDYDPDVFTEAMDPETWNHLIDSPEKPLYNRATMNLLPPGSTWKPFMALMALQEGSVAPEEHIYCRGYHPLGGAGVFRDMHVHENIAVEEALEKSCNTFFFELMMRTNIEVFSSYAHMFGFGEHVATDIGDQGSGLIPDSAYYNERFPSWGPGYTINLGVGQGDMGVTPLQLARYAAAVANGGMLYTPHLVTRMTHAETGEIRYPTIAAPVKLPIDAAHFEVVREGMKRVMEAGTGQWIQIPDIPSGGKTGTAQAPHDRKDDSVFILFAPYDNPQIAVAVQVENAGFGAVAAGPIGSLMAEQYLTGGISRSPARQWILQSVLAIESQPLHEDVDARPDENAPEEEDIRLEERAPEEEDVPAETAQAPEASAPADDA